MFMTFTLNLNFRVRFREGFFYLEVMLLIMKCLVLSGLPESHRRKAFYVGRNGCIHGPF